eukprot:gene29274-35341_t
MSERSWWRMVVKSTVDQSLDPSYTLSDSMFTNYFNLVYDYYALPEAYIVYDDTIELLKYAQSHGIRIGVLTNSSQRTVKIVLPALNLSSYVSFSLSCQDLGHAKPSAQAFQAAISRFRDIDKGIESASILHVGDDDKEDWKGAKAAGLQAILIDRQNQCALHKGDKICLPSLAHIPPLLTQP